MSLTYSYDRIIKNILELKESPTTPRLHTIEQNNYHYRRLQPTDIDTITEVLEKEGISKFDFSAELYCRTLLAQIIHFEYNKYFNQSDVENNLSSEYYKFVEIVGCCPTPCQRHIQPIALPLFILYWNSSTEYIFNGSDNPSDEDAHRTMKEYIEKFKDYKIEFLKRLPPLLEYIIIPNTPQSVKEGIANDFSNFSFTIY